MSGFSTELLQMHFGRQETQNYLFLLFCEIFFIPNHEFSLYMFSYTVIYDIRAAIVNAYKERDWNKEFQSIMAASQFLFSDAGDISAVDDWDKYGALSHLARDFIYASKLYAKVIISELCVPTEHKTIRPVKIGGIAGGSNFRIFSPCAGTNLPLCHFFIGDKYICGGILFKFALDTRGLYGGDEYAMKAASHELKGLQCLYQAGIALGLNFPFVTPKYFSATLPRSF
jgi:hypothetical protein